MSAPIVTLEELRLANREAAERFPYDYHQGFGRLGLILMPELTSRFYEDFTPMNCLCFAHTGGNGVHFSFLGVGQSEAVDGPVVITNPPAMEPVNWIVGENLYDFLCLGYYRGFFALEQIAYKREPTLQAFTDPTWQASEQWHDWAGFTLNDHKRKLLDFLINRFDLKPWPSAERFYELQEKYAGKLILPPLP